MSHPQYYSHKEPFLLESGKLVYDLRLAYSTFGSLNYSRNNAVWIFHALTANSNPAEWWQGIIGKGLLIDPEKYFIVCVNMPGSCYGSFSPFDKNPLTGMEYLHSFPYFSIRDMIRAYKPLRRALGIKRILLGIGGSMGGQQLLEWAIEEPDLFEHIVPIATNAVHSPWGKAFNASQRMAIENDETWIKQTSDSGMEGMKVARSIALLSYRNYQTYHNSQNDNGSNSLDGFRSESYQRYQGEKLAKRFNAYSYYFLTKSMDTHNVGREREGIKSALSKIKAKALVIGIESDLLFPTSEQQFMIEHIPSAKGVTIQSDYGHDGFLIENSKLTDAVQKAFPQSLEKSARKSASFIRV